MDGDEFDSEPVKDMEYWNNLNKKALSRAIELNEKYSQKYILIADGKFVAWGTKMHMMKHIDRNPEWKEIILKMITYNENGAMAEHVSIP